MVWAGGNTAKGTRTGPERRWSVRPCLWNRRPGSRPAGGGVLQKTAARLQVKSDLGGELAPPPTTGALTVDSLAATAILG